MYYCTIEVQIEYTFYTYEYNVYFESKSACTRWKKFFNENKHNDLVHIKKSGQADFDVNGVLMP